MILDIGDRQTGKTTRMIRAAAASRATIVEPTHMAALQTLAMAHGMGLDIPKPLSTNALAHPELFGRADIIVDEAQDVLAQLMHVPADRILAMAIRQESLATTFDGKVVPFRAHREQ